jgi:hypothetical protein
MILIFTVVSRIGLTIEQLGVSNASLFCRGPVRFLSLDGIAFARPVPIGSILRLESMILHTTSTEEYPVLVVGSFQTPALLNPLTRGCVVARRRESQCCGCQDWP